MRTVTLTPDDIAYARVAGSDVTPPETTPHAHLVGVARSPFGLCLAWQDGEDIDVYMALGGLWDYAPSLTADVPAMLAAAVESETDILDSPDYLRDRAEDASFEAYRDQRAERG